MPLLFRVSPEVLALPRQYGGLGLPDVRERCRALLIGRWHAQLLLDPDGLSAEWLLVLRSAYGVGNPPNLRAVWAAAPHYKAYWETAAYSRLPSVTTSARETRKDVADALAEARVTAAAPPRVAAKHPQTNWHTVWENINSNVLPADLKDAWWTAVHDLPATKARLQATGQTGSGACRCGQQDDLRHRLSGCGNAAHVWPWVEDTLRRLTGRTLTPDAILRPDFTGRTKEAHAAALYVAATVAEHFGKTSATATGFVAKVRAGKAKPWRSKVLVQGLKSVK